MPESGRPIVRWILAGVFLLLSLNAFVQVVMHLLHMNTDPPSLTVLQLITGSGALGAGLTTWRGSPRAWVWSLIYGATAVLLLGSLGPILDLAPEEVSGIWMGAGVLALFAIGAAWYLRRNASMRASLPH